MSMRLRIVLTLATLLLLPVYSSVAGAETGTSLRISVSPVSGPQETAIAVTGTGAQVSTPGQVMMASDGDTGAGALTVVQVDPDSSGNFAATIVVPADALDGRYAVRVEQRTAQGSLLQYYWASFSVGNVLIPETGGLQGTYLTVTAVLAALLVALMFFQGTRLAVKG